MDKAWRHAVQSGQRGNTAGFACRKGTSYVGINLKDVRNLLLPVPSGSEQLRIVSELNAMRKQVDDLKLLQAETADALGALRPSILSKAFAGSL